MPGKVFFQGKSKASFDILIPVIVGLREPRHLVKRKRARIHQIWIASASKLAGGSRRWCFGKNCCILRCFLNLRTLLNFCDTWQPFKVNFSMAFYMSHCDKFMVFLFKVMEPRFRVSISLLVVIFITSSVCVSSLLSFRHEYYLNIWIKD